MGLAGDFFLPACLTISLFVWVYLSIYFLSICRVNHGACVLFACRAACFFFSHFFVLSFRHFFIFCVLSVCF